LKEVSIDILFLKEISIDKDQYIKEGFLVIFFIFICLLKNCVWKTFVAYQRGQFTVSLANGLF
jgi:hypothetical protein